MNRYLLLIVIPVLQAGCADVAATRPDTVPPGTFVAEPILDYPSRCEECRIELTRRVLVGDASGPVSLDLLAQVVALADGERFMAGRLLERGQLAVYSGTGAFQRTVGRYGEGPTELQSVRQLRRWQDTVYAFQDDRVVLIGPDLEPVRSIRLPVPPREIAVLQDGSTLVMWLEPGSTPQFVRLHRDGHADTIRAEPSRYVGGIAAAEDGFWTVGLTDYTLTRFDMAGNAIRTIRTEQSWFAPWRLDPSTPSPSFERPNPRVVALREIGDQIWTLILVADRDWRPAAEGSDPHFDHTFDTIIQILDANSGELMAAGRADAALWDFTDEGFALARHKDPETGSMLAALYELTLVGDVSELSLGL